VIGSIEGQGDASGKASLSQWLHAWTESCATKDDAEIAQLLHALNSETAQIAHSLQVAREPPQQPATDASDASDELAHDSSQEDVPSEASPEAEPLT